MKPLWTIVSRPLPSFHSVPRKNVTNFKEKIVTFCVKSRWQKRNRVFGVRILQLLYSAPGLYGKGCPRTPLSFTRARHAQPFYALWEGQPRNGRFRGGPPAGCAAYGRLLPPWYPTLYGPVLQRRRWRRWSCDRDVKWPDVYFMLSLCPNPIWPDPIWPDSQSDSNLIWLDPYLTLW
jgi:hypothetical protein